MILYPDKSIHAQHKNIKNISKTFAIQANLAKDRKGDIYDLE